MLSDWGKVEGLGVAACLQVVPVAHLQLLVRGGGFRLPEDEGEVLMVDAQRLVTPRHHRSPVARHAHRGASDPRAGGCGAGVPGLPAQNDLHPCPQLNLKCCTLSAIERMYGELGGLVAR